MRYLASLVPDYNTVLPKRKETLEKKEMQKEMQKEMLRFPAYPLRNKRLLIE